MAKNPPDMRSAAEKAFKAVTTKPADLPPKAPAIPGAKEMVSLRIDRDVLDFFQARRPRLAGPHQRGAAQGRGKVTRHDETRCRSVDGNAGDRSFCCR